jgi:hypothetical protein
MEFGRNLAAVPENATAPIAMKANQRAAVAEIELLHRFE